MEGLYANNAQAINEFLDVAPQFQKIQNRFGAAASKAEAMADRALNRGNYWANELTRQGDASASKLHRLGNQSLEAILGYAEDVAQGEEKLQARADKADQLSERILEKSEQMWDQFAAYEEKTLLKSEQYLSKHNKWAAKAIDLQAQNAADANLELAANVVAQNEAQQSQFGAAREAIMASDLPDQVKEAQLVQLDQKASAAYMRNGAETQAAAVQAKFAIDSSVSNMMMAASEHEAATSGIYLQTQQALTQMGSFVMSQGIPSMTSAALSAQELGTQATIAAQGVVESAAGIKTAGQQLKMGYAQAAESAKMRGVESAAQADLSFAQTANNAMANSINALNGQLQAVFGEAKVLEGAANLTLQSNAMMANWFQHASSLATQTEFQVHNANVNAAMRSAEIRAQAEGRIFEVGAGMEGNIYSGTMRANEVALNQVNIIAEHHAAYRANPVSVADIFLGMMSAEAASYAAGWGSLANNPAIGFNMGNQWQNFFG
jgi:hypothetical protein